MGALVDAVVARLDDRADRIAIEQRLDELWQAATRNWPGVRCDPSKLGAALVRSLGDRPITPDSVASLRAEELYLAVACLEGDREALRVFDRKILPALDPALRRLALSATEIAEVRQRLRVFLLVGESNAPKLHEYAGRGSLIGWITVCAVRLVIRERGRNRQDPEDDVKLARMAGAIDDVEERYIKRVVQDAFSVALREAIAALEPRDRLLLAQHYLDAMTLDAMAHLHRTHRATVTRWLAAARASLLTRTRARLKERCGIDDAECDSVIRHAQSQFDETLGRALRDAR